MACPIASSSNESTRNTTTSRAMMQRPPAPTSRKDLTLEYLYAWNQGAGRDAWNRMEPRQQNQTELTDAVMSQQQIATV